MNNDCNYEFSFNKVTKEQVLNGLVSISISGYEVKELITDRFDDVINVFRECGEHGRGKLIITFGGYDYVPEEIYEIPEIRNYVAMLFNKYPYLFYFISDIDLNNKVILACLSDIETVFIGDEKKSLNKTFYENGKKHDVGIKFNISKDVRVSIVNGIIDYAKSIDDEIKNIEDILESLFSFTPQENIVDDNPFTNIYEAFFKTSKQLWIAYVDMVKHKRLSVEEVKQFPSLNEYIRTVVTNGYLSAPLFLNQGTSTNVFIVNDLSYGDVCKDCSSSIAVIVKDGFETEQEAFDEMAFVPSWEYFMNRGITPFDDEYLKQIPVPVDADKDIWYCPICGKVHTFVYDDIIGLCY